MLLLQIKPPCAARTRPPILDLGVSSSDCKKQQHYSASVYERFVYFSSRYCYRSLNMSFSKFMTHKWIIALIQLYLDDWISCKCFLLILEFSLSDQDTQTMWLEIDVFWHAYALIGVKPDNSFVHAPTTPVLAYDHGAKTCKNAGCICTINKTFIFEIKHAVQLSLFLLLTTLSASWFTGQLKYTETH